MRLPYDLLTCTGRYWRAAFPSSKAFLISLARHRAITIRERNNIHKDEQKAGLIQRRKFLQRAHRKKAIDGCVLSNRPYPRSARTERVKTMYHSRCMRAHLSTKESGSSTPLVPFHFSFLLLAPLQCIAECCSQCSPIDTHNRAAGVREAALASAGPFLFVCCCSHLLYFHFVNNLSIISLKIFISRV